MAIPVLKKAVEDRKGGRRGETMKRSGGVPIGIVAWVSSLALAMGCGAPDPPPTHERLCGDVNGNRVDDQKCIEEQQRGAQGSYGGGYHPLYFWHYGPYGRSYPMGGSLYSAGASRVMPTGPGVRVGSSTVRGGFGGTARGSGAGE
jgi:hypothetical protein